MCLVTTSYKFIETPKDIICYKMVYKIADSEGNFYITPYQNNVIPNLGIIYKNTSEEKFSVPITFLETIKENPKKI